MYYTPTYQPEVHSSLVLNINESIHLWLLLAHSPPRLATVSNRAPDSTQAATREQGISLDGLWISLVPFFPTGEKKHRVYKHKFSLVCKL